LHVLICNFFIVVNYNCKLTFFFNDTSTFVVVKHHLEVIHIVSQFYVLSRIFRNRNTCFNGYLIKYHRAVKNNSCYNNNMFSIKAYFKGLNSTQYVLYKMQRICFNACKNVEYQMIKKKKKYYNNWWIVNDGNNVLKCWIWLCWVINERNESYYSKLVVFVNDHT
jgi:hypothetical protein